MKKKLIIIAVLLFLAFFFLNFNSSSIQEKVNSSPVAPTSIVSNNFSYKGENGKDALSILKEKTTVGEDGTGLVVSIGGRKAEDKDREYWSFYVNGKMAEVGPADFQTKDTDLIEWKIEKY